MSKVRRALLRRPDESSRGHGTASLLSDSARTLYPPAPIRCDAVSPSPFTHHRCQFRPMQPNLPASLHRTILPFARRVIPGPSTNERMTSWAVPEMRDVPACLCVVRRLAQQQAVSSTTGMRPSSSLQQFTQDANCPVRCPLPGIDPPAQDA